MDAAEFVQPQQLALGFEIEDHQTRGSGASLDITDVRVPMSIVTSSGSKAEAWGVVDSAFRKIVVCEPVARG